MLLELSQIIVGKRQRSEISTIPLAELRESILARGLINPITVESLGHHGFALCAGERRLRAIQQIYEAGLTFRHGNSEVPTGMIPVTQVTELDDLQRMYLEHEENEIRENFSWQDRDRALYAIHQLELSRNPEQTFTATAESIAAKGGSGTATSVERLRHKVRQASIIGEHLHIPAVAKARTSDEALRIIIEREEAQVNAERHRRMVARAPQLVQQIVILKGDCAKLLPDLEAGRFSLILTDPPYGAGAGDKGFRDRTVHHHNYVDTPEAAMNAIKHLLVEGWRLTKPVANIFIFSGIDHFPFFKAQCSTMGWTPFPVPIVWRKSLSEGLAPWGRNGFRRTTEFIFYAQKGGRGLLNSPVDVLEVKRVHRSERIYAAQKPLDLMMQLIECSTLPGEAILDPYLGSGSTLAAAKRLNRIGTGIELDPQVADIATNFIFKGELDDIEPTSPSEPESNLNGLIPE